MNIYIPVKPRIKAYTYVYDLWVRDVKQFNILCECFFNGTRNMTLGRLS